MSTVGEAPDEWPEDWKNEYSKPRLNSKQDARPLILLCQSGEYRDAWDTHVNHYITESGRIPVFYFERAQNMLIGVDVPPTGRPATHDWKMVLEIYKQTDAPTKKERRAITSAIYEEKTSLYLDPENSDLRAKTRPY